MQNNSYQIQQPIFQLSGVHIWCNVSLPLVNLQSKYVCIYYEGFYLLSAWKNSHITQEAMSLFQYLIRRLIVRYRKASKPRDLNLELSNHSVIWQVHRQQCCRGACQISKRCHDLNYQSCGFEISHDLTIRRLIRYWNGAHYISGWDRANIKVI